VLALAVAIWVRNRDILSDLYDYSSIIAGAGKIEVGLKPYVDFRSTMQSASYVLTRAVELIAGRSYLGLTWGGLTLTLGGAVALFALWRRPFGAVGAALLASAMALSGFSQHVIEFYNPLGLLCLTIVFAGLADAPSLWPVRGWRTWLVLSALVLGGTNKLNFQALAIAVGGLLILRAAVAGELRRGHVVASLAMLVAAGLIVPIGLELVWTGASMALWVDNVILLAKERIGELTLLGNLEVYLKPANDLHRYLLFKPLTPVGLGLVAITAVAAGAVRWRQQTLGWRRTGECALLVATALAVAFGGVLLTITNVESIALTSLGFVGGGGALWGAFAGRTNEFATRRLQWLVPVAAMLWTVVGGYAAWQGSRVMFARRNIDRATFVRLVNAPFPLRYLEGVRLDAGLYQSLMLTAKEVERLAAERGDLRRVLFGPTLEWMERAYPETVMRGMPVWYHVGTALSENDGPWLRAQLEGRGIDRIFLHPGWESWPWDFRTYLDDQFRKIALGPVVRLYERDTPESLSAPTGIFAEHRPLAWLERTGSNIQVRSTRLPDSPRLGFHASPWGAFFGGEGGWTWKWRCNVNVMDGTLTAVWPKAAGGPVLVTGRVVARDRAKPEVIWQHTMQLSEKQPEQRAPFAIAPAGRKLDFETEVTGDPNAHVITGWREMIIKHAGDTTEDVPPPIWLNEAARPIRLGSGRTAWVRGEGGVELPAKGKVSSPFEAWVYRPEGSSPWKVSLEYEHLAKTGGDVPIVMVVWYRSGRFDLLSQQALPAGAGVVTLETRMTEPGGWIGVVVRRLQPDRPFNSRVRVVDWEW